MHNLKVRKKNKPQRISQLLLLAKRSKKYYCVPDFTYVFYFHQVYYLLVWAEQQVSSQIS